MKSRRNLGEEILSRHPMLIDAEMSARRVKLEILPAVRDFQLCISISDGGVLECPYRRYPRRHQRHRWMPLLLRTRRSW